VGLGSSHLQGVLPLHCRDFIQVFNRLWVVQLMPENWHQISLSSGWMGAAAGGPAAAVDKQGVAGTGAVGHATAYTPAEDSRAATKSAVAQADGRNSKLLGNTASQQQQQQSLAGASVSMFSSWCCNPQFRLSMAGSGQVIVCLGQRDPQVGGRGVTSMTD
jgi:hypothetical protein